MKFRVVCLALAVLPLMAACATETSASRPPGDVERSRPISPLFEGSEPVGPINTTGTGPGSLVSARTLDQNIELQDVDARVTRVVYRSTSGIDNSPTEVSGVVAVPPGREPSGGWPVIAFGHGTTGVLNKCAPSDFDSLVGNGSMIASMIQSGFAVTMPDYQGLGVRGYYHPFLDSSTFGNNMIDAVRAAHRLDPAIGTNWVAFGHSLGGMAAWAAADRAGQYGGGMSLKGTLSMAPPADMSGLADAASKGTLTGDQRVALIFALQSLTYWNPGFDLDRYRSPLLAANWGTLIDCTANQDKVAATRKLITNADLKPRTVADTDRLRGLLEKMALPKNKTTGPVSVIYGTEDELVDSEWTDSALARACAKGDFIEIEKRVGQGHGDLDSANGLPWLKDRIDGVGAVNSCPATAR